MSSMRVSFGQYLAQRDCRDMCSANMNNVAFHSTGHGYPYSVAGGDAMHDDFNGMECPQVSVTQIDEEEIPEEKMHSPRTPIGSLPDPVQGKHRRSEFHFHFRTQQQPQQRTIPATNMQRTISASSADTSISFIDTHEAMHEPVLSYASSLSVGYSVELTPQHSPCATPTAVSVPVHLSLHADADAEDKGDRNSNIQAIHEVLTTKLTAAKQQQQQQQQQHGRARGFHRYKHGLGTYSSGHNSGVNTTGTATPASMEPLSRHSSCASTAHGSDAGASDGDVSFETEDSSDGVIEVEQLANAPVYVPMAVMTDAEDELETPVPSDAEPSFVFSWRELPTFDADAIKLAKIAEDSVVDRELLCATPDTVVTAQTDASDKSALKTTVYDMIDNVSSDEDEEDEQEDVDEDDDGDEDDNASVTPVPVACAPHAQASKGVDVRVVAAGDEEEEEAIWMDLEDEIASKAARLQSSRVLFLDVDGVLLSVKEQSRIAGSGVSFNPHVTALMRKVCRETQCDVIVSSTWQFYAESHLAPLIAFLCDCGWRRNQVHTLLSLLPESKCERDPTVYGREWYEESPYCYCRARGIQKIVSLYASHISRWCALDDLPLHSSKRVCIPKAQDLSGMVDRLAHAYYSSLVWSGVKPPPSQSQSQADVQVMAEIAYCVKYAITNLPNALFCTQSYRFGYESNRTMIYYQSDAIAKLIKLTYELKESASYQRMIESLMAVICDYVDSQVVYQGDPYIAPYLVQTDQECGITDVNIDNAITLLTYAGTGSEFQLNDCQK